MRKILRKFSLVFGMCLLIIGSTKSQNGELILTTPDLSKWTCEVGEVQTFIWKYNYTLDGADKDCDNVNPASIELAIGNTAQDDAEPTVEIIGGPSIAGCFVSLNFKCLTDEPLSLNICANSLSTFQANGADNTSTGDDGIGCFDLADFINSENEEVDSDDDGVLDAEDCAPNDPNASSNGDACDDDNPNTENDQYDSNCNCIGEEIIAVVDSDNDGVPDAEDCAPNDPNASDSGDTCDDGNSDTENDQYDSNCNCIGEEIITVMDSDNDGVPDEDDCAPDDPNASSRFDACDDGDSNTENDQYDSNCNCRGQEVEAVDSDGDGVPDDEDCAPNDPNASSRFDACDDGNPNTENDQYDSNCNCRGRAVDSDGDGVPDDEDCAPDNPNASSRFDACDDGNPDTENDQYDSNCNCRGQEIVPEIDSDGDGVLDGNDCAPNDPNASSRFDDCDDGNPDTVNDQYDSNCNCRGRAPDSDGDGVPDTDDCAPDDPSASSRFDACDDGDPNTVNDQYDSNCNCKGEDPEPDSDNDGVPDADDCAPDDPNASSRFDDCDDGDPNTVNDRYDSNCNCRGQAPDSDGDGVPDTDDCAPDDPNASSRFDACDDGNPNTNNDQYDSNCNCRGEEEPTITFGPSESVVFYDLDDCFSTITSGADEYSEFTASYPNALDCATFTSSSLHRANPNLNKHSCTPGAAGTAAMCVSARIECDYSKSSDQALVFEVEVNASDLVRISALKFLEKAPEQFDWINGASGPNNYPTQYGVRILVDGEEVFFEDDISTTTEWTEESFSFDDYDIIIDGNSTVTIEMLAYCPVGNGATASVWDIENVELYADCSTSSSSVLISGMVTSIDDTPLSDVLLTLRGYDFQQEYMTSAKGAFDFGEVPMSSGYTLDATKRTEYLKGVSTLDIVSIQKHILGKEVLNDAFRYIAADINRDNRISAADMVQLRKLILGVYDELPDNDSYRFYDQNELIEMTSPWEVQEELEFTNIEDFYSTLNLSGIKIGDVNIMQTETRSREKSVLTYKFRNSDKNIVDFYFENAETFKAIQLNLFLKDSNLGELISGQLELDNSDYNILDDHELRVSKNFEELISFDSDEPLFSIVVDQNKLLDHHLTLIQDIAIKSELYNSTTDFRSIELKAINEIPASANSIALYPNPFSEKLFVRIDLDIEQKVSIEIFDVNGRRLYNYSERLSSGENIVIIDEIPFGNLSSLLISKVTIGNKVYTNKIVQIQR